MSDRHIDIDVDITEDDLPEEPLFEESACGGADEEFTDDQEGVFGFQPLKPIEILLPKPCSVKTLNGSWLLTLTPPKPTFLNQIRGPMRIEVGGSKLRVSGDIYVKRLFGPIIQPRPGVTVKPISPEPVGTFIPGSLVISRNWYPAFPQREYRWYFRSLGVSYSKGKLIFKFERHLWSNSSQSFVSKDNGWMEFQCQASPVKPIGVPQPTIEMKGTAMIGGTKYECTATKTSPYYRGCLVEVDVMTNRQWPATATSCDNGRTYSYTGVYRAAGMDFRAVVNEVNLPDDPLLSVAEMHTLLATHRSLSAGANNWRLWLLVGSRMDGTLGLMFDTGNPPHREGAVGFYDPTLPNIDIIDAPARGKKLGEVPLAFLRTMIHEAGHAFNLYHPKHDVHTVAVGTTIMNQTGDVMGFATAADPYPCNATMGFNDHNRTSLIHSPDPQVKPGWKEFGWGHGSAWSGVAEPVDAVGLVEDGPEAGDIQLSLTLPAEAVRGEFVSATVTMTNNGTQERDVTTALNLAEGDLRITVTTPSGQVINARDVVMVCGVRRMQTLQSQESISGSVQLFYGPHGLTFDQPGRYEVSAELEIGDGTVVQSDPVTLVVRSAVTESERSIEQLTMNKNVGLSLALGDFGTDTDARDKLISITEQFVTTDTGAACAMVVANSLGRELRDVRNAQVLRPKDQGEASRIFDLALQGRDATTAAHLCAAVVSPRETAAPLLDMMQQQLKKSGKGAYASEDKQLASKVITDHLA